MGVTDYVICSNIYSSWTRQNSLNGMRFMQFKKFKNFPHVLSEKKIERKKKKNNNNMLTAELRACYPAIGNNRTKKKMRLHKHLIRKII